MIASSALILSPLFSSFPLSLPFSARCAREQFANCGCAANLKKFWEEFDGVRELLVRQTDRVRELLSNTNSFVRKLSDRHKSFHPSDTAHAKFSQRQNTTTP